MTGRQKKYLRGLAHDLKPVVRIGKNGLTDAVLESVDAALDSHELIKVKFGESKDEKEEICQSLAEELEAHRIGMIGNVAILYREAEDPEDRKILLPE